MKRKIVQIAFAPTGDDTLCDWYALADDGTVWFYGYDISSTYEKYYRWKLCEEWQLPDTGLEEKQNEPKN